MRSANQPERFHEASTFGRDSLTSGQPAATVETRSVRPSGPLEVVRPWYQHRSLRFRLMMWNVFVVVITGVATVIGMREGVRFALLRELDEVLREDFQEVQLTIDRFGDARASQLHEQLDRKAQGHSQIGWFAQLSDATGAVVYRSSHAPDSELLATLPLHADPATQREWRIFTARKDDLSPATIWLGVSMANLRQDVARIDRMAALAIGVILLVAPPCGFWLAGRATKPLAEIITTMSQLRPAKLDERLSLRGTGDELDRLSNTFNRLLDRIGGYLQEKRDFLANAAHELRTPLAAIRSTIEVTLASDRSSEEYRELLDEIIQESDSLQLLINQLLLLAEVENVPSATYRDPVPLDALMQKGLDMFSGVAESRDIALVAGRLQPIAIPGNRHHLRQVVNNLLDNAIKFTQGGGTVRGEVYGDAVDGVVILRVIDTGSGIAPADLPHVSERFYRAKSGLRTTNEPRGTGLGLSICQAIVTAHGGTLELTSTLGKGTTVEVRLPLEHKSEV